MTLKWKNLDATHAYATLSQKEARVHMTHELTAKRIREWSIPAGGGLDFHYGAALVSSTDLERLHSLAEEQQIIPKYSALLRGECINTSEGRQVLHHHTRGIFSDSLIKEGPHLGAFYSEQTARIKDFSNAIIDGEIKGSTGMKFDTVVQIGIGGSDLGPRALYIALKGAYSTRLKAFFVSNVDPDDAIEVIAQINPETTLFVLVSKSGTTQETLANRDLILDQMRSQGISGYDTRKHLVAVTSRTSPLAESEDVLKSFYIDDSIGGRFSSTSAVGAVVLSLAFGPDVFSELLAGANDADLKALEKDIFKNASMMDALIGIYQRNFLGLPATAILPYSQALSRFPAHLQQLDMESNGKSVNRDGEKIHYATGPIIFGEPGTNGQHSFFQWLHQSADVVPLQFIGFRKSQRGVDIRIEGSTSQSKLNANLAAQIVAFAKGKQDKNLNKNFDGMRSSTVLVADRLNARSLGALLAHFENKTMFQGFCWNLNSFDQEGVQLGKKLANALLDGSSKDAALTAYATILGV